jgi:hypothetical protein
MRGPWARRMRDVLELHALDLGGPDNISEAERRINPPRVQRNGPSAGQLH